MEQARTPIPPVPPTPPPTPTWEKCIFDAMQVLNGEPEPRTSTTTKTKRKDPPHLPSVWKECGEALEPRKQGPQKEQFDW